MLQVRIRVEGPCFRFGFELRARVRARVRVHASVQVSITLVSFFLTLTLILFVTDLNTKPNNSRKKIYKEEIIVPIIFILLDIVCFFMADVSPEFLVEQVSVRFIRNGVLVLALIFPIVAGMGLNFCVTVGAMAAQSAYLIVLNANIQGGAGVLLVFLLTVILNIGVGLILGKIMNLVKGREMIYIFARPARHRQC